MLEAESSEEMFDKEREMVELGPHSYNLKEGGEGGWGYINNHKLMLTERHKNAAVENIKKGTEEIKRLHREDSEWAKRFRLSVKKGMILAFKNR